MAENLSSESIALKISEANSILDRIIGFVEHCDSKASIMLGFISVLITITIPSGIMECFLFILKQLFSNLSITNIFKILIILTPIAFILISILLLISVLSARTKVSDFDSSVYFADIANNANKRMYADKFLGISEKEYLDDLLSQIYINSRICSNKFEKYNYGLKLGIIGVILIVVLYILVNIFH